ncbi:MAG: hypothetical protein QM570_14985 [Planctomycetota bacterium]|nr:hypothetical protein [Planctomycetota bacterium]
MFIVLDLRTHVSDVVDVVAIDRNVVGAGVYANPGAGKFTISDTRIGNNASIMQPRLKRGAAGKNEVLPYDILPFGDYVALNDCLCGSIPASYEDRLFAGAIRKGIVHIAGGGSVYFDHASFRKGVWYRRSGRLGRSIQVIRVCSVRICVVYIMGIVAAFGVLVIGQGGVAIGRIVVHPVGLEDSEFRGGDADGGLPGLEMGSDGLVGIHRDAADQAHAPQITGPVAEAVASVWPRDQLDGLTLIVLGLSGVYCD